MLLLLALAVGLYMTATAKGDGGAVDPTQTAQIVQPSQTATEAAQTCTVTTGINNGTVNLRACGSTSCGVITVLNDSDILTVTSGGVWLKVVTVNNLRGYINSKFCK